MNDHHIIRVFACCYKQFSHNNQPVNISFTFQTKQKQEKDSDHNSHDLPKQNSFLINIPQTINIVHVEL